MFNPAPRSPISASRLFALTALAAVLGLTAVLSTQPVEAATNITFFAASDMHFGNSSATNDTNRNRMPARLHALPGLNWPTAIGGVVDTPRALLNPGDLIERQDSILWLSYTNILGINGEKVLKYPVFESTGNHDFYTTGTTNGRPAKTDTLWVTKQLIERNLPRRASFTNYDSAGYHYSWDWDGVHFINLNLYAGSTELGYNGYRPQKALEFLTQDLAAHVGTSGRPVFIMQHYTFDANGNVNNDWTPTLKAKAWTVLQNYNVIGLLHGHSHGKKFYRWNNIPVFDDGSVMVGDALVFRITDGRLVAANRIASGVGTAWGTLVFDSTISMGTVGVKQAHTNISAYHNILFSIPEAGFNQLIPASVRRIMVSNLAGKTVRVLAVRNNRIEWNRKDAYGQRVPAGLYVIREEGKGVALGKVLLR
jgi:hypothetical protein